MASEVAPKVDLKEGELIDLSFDFVVCDQRALYAATASPLHT